MNEASTRELHERLGRLLSKGLKVSTPVAMLRLVREKIGSRDYQPFDKEDILQELGRLQHITDQLIREMLYTYELLKREG